MCKKKKNHRQKIATNENSFDTTSIDGEISGKVITCLKIDHRVDGMDMYGDNGGRDYYSIRWNFRSDYCWILFQKNLAFGKKQKRKK